MFGIFGGQYSTLYFIEKKNERILIEIELLFQNYELTATISHKQEHSPKIKKLMRMI